MFKVALKNVQTRCKDSTFFWIVQILQYIFHVFSTIHPTPTQRLAVRGLAISIAVFEVNAMNAFLLAKRVFV